MSSSKEKQTTVEKISAFIVDKRKGFYFIYILLLVFSLFSSGWVKVNNDITDYLSEDTETKRGLDIMENEFITYATAQIMADNISYEDAQSLCARLEEIDGIKEIAFDDTEDHYKDGSALYSVTFDGDSDDEICSIALDEATEILSDYDSYVSAELGDTSSKRIASEMKVIMIIACIIILAVLLFTSQTYMEIPVQILTFGVAALLNLGTNYMFGTISFISNSIAVVLQLALAIDYAIILCHRYTEEREELDAREAVIAALGKAIPEISGSCLTTLSGLAALAFMQFKIGLDMSLVLIKAIIISIICVFTLMPGLLMSFSSLIDKTHHKSFVPNIAPFAKIVVKLRYVTPVIFAIIAVGALILSSNCPYAYSTADLPTTKTNETQIAKQMITDTFGKTNTLAVIVPSGDYEKEQLLEKDLEKYDQIDSITALASVEATDGYNVGDMLTPREFSELCDMDIEVCNLLYSLYALENEDYGKLVSGIDGYKVALIDLFDFAYDAIDNDYITLDESQREDLDEVYDALTDGKNQLESEKYTRFVINLNLPEESEETFAFLETVRECGEKYYPENVILAGNSTSNKDLASSFVNDNMVINVISIVFVVLVLFFTFQSAGIPIILTLVIQGSIWINFSFPTLQNQPLYFLGYLVVSSIQMGANIDYAIVITNRYTELRQKMSKYDAIKDSINLAFPTIFTSGSILACAGFAIGFFSSDPVISTIGICLGRGTLISIVLVLLILPQLLVLGDKIIEKTSFSMKFAKQKKTHSGKMSVDGRIRGYVNGYVDGAFSGTVNGKLDASVMGGTVEKIENNDENTESEENANEN